jgi:hypothetical protein
LTLTPRVWFAWENDSFFQDNRFTQQTQETYFYPFYGGSVTATSPGGTSYSLTILHGEGDAKLNGATLTQVPVFGVYQVKDGDVSNERTDVEGIAQIPLSEGVSGILGARFINFQRDERSTFTAVDPEFFGIPPAFVGQTGRFQLEQNFWLGEIGFGVSRPVNARGSIRFFGNLIGMFGNASVETFKTPTESASGIFNLQREQLEGAVIGVDTNAGVAFDLSQNMVLSGRYRIFYLSAPDVKFDVGGYFIHGPEVNLSFTF